MPVPLRLSYLPPISSAGITVDIIDNNSRRYDFLFGNDQIPVIHLSGSPFLPESLTTYKTSVSVLTSFFPWELLVINPENLSQGGFYWTTLGSLSTYGELDVLNFTSNRRNLFTSGIGINTNRNDYQVTIFQKSTGGVVVRNDEVRGSQLVIGLDTQNHGSYIQAGKFGGFRFSRPLIFRFAAPAPTEVMKLDTNSFLCIGDDITSAPAKLTIKGNISAAAGFNNFTSTSGGGSISAMALNQEGSYFAGPLCIGTSMLTRNPGLLYGNISVIDAMVVGGGGGGGAFGGGGGGGGIQQGTYNVSQGVYSVTVGNGGAAGTFNGSVYTAGGDGGISLIDTLLAANGGGGGGNWPNGNGRNGSSGGGGGGTGLGGSGTPGLGFNGGIGGSASTTPYRGQGGGGGAGAPGQAGQQGTGGVIGGNGGAGLSNNITGTTLFYGGGGGGMTMGNSTGIGNTTLAQGGQGGGGNSGRFYTPTIGAQSGTPNTGGGGGAGTGSAGQLAGAGGSGVVIIRYGGYQRALGGDVIYNTIINGTVYTIHEFRTPGTSNFTVLDTSLFENAPVLVVTGSVSGTGTLSATKDGSFAFNSLSGNLGIGTNTFENRNLKLAVIGNVTTESGGLSVTDSTQRVFLGSKLGVGPNSYTDAANGLTVVGNISSTGPLSASGPGFTFIAGNVGINMPNTATTLSNVNNQKLTVVGNISATGTLSATNSNLHNYLGGILAVGDRFNIGGVQSYNTGTGFNDIVFKNAYTRDAISITVGAGGTGAPAGIGQPRGSNGSNSNLGTLISIGGGGGASCHDRSTSPAGDGGSGGGASGGGAAGQPVGQGGGGYGGGFRGLGTPGQGFEGGAGIYAWYPGGGGGAGGPGTRNPATGGPGILNRILGSDYYWGGGGGGSGYSGSGGSGGIGGGGGGAVLATNGGVGFDGSGLVNGQPGGGGSINSQTNTPGGNGGQNTGGGGGGGSHYSANNFGGNGGSGIVIVRYPGFQRADGGTVYSIVDSGTTYTVHLFTTVGTNTFSRHLTSSDFNLEYLIVAGGGGGGSDMGGGGGAGGVLAGTTSYSSLVDGIYYGGNFTSFNTIATNRMVRLNSTGSIDSNFAYGAGFNGQVYALDQDNSKAVYVGGSFTTYQGNTNPGIIRLNDNGTKDTLFVNGAGFTGGLATVSAISVDTRNNIQVDILVVGGGGGGGGWGGGGGAGGVVQSTLTIPRQAYNITVGGGGAPGTSLYTGGTRGGDSSAFGIGAVGGGGGGWYSQNNGRPGGSGGGGGGSETDSTLPLALGGSGISGQGFQGGRGGGRPGGVNYNGGGGGGGAGGPGNDFVGIIGGAGGPGISSSITGTAIFYGGGGGGHSPGQVFPPNDYALGGVGGGGDGGRYGNGSAGLRNATSGTANTGGGGGGAWGGAGSAIGSGGSGVVMVRYFGPQIATGGTVSTVTVGISTYTLHTFTSVGNSKLDFGGIFLGGNFTAYKGTAANNIIKVNGAGDRDTSFNYGTGFNGGVHAIALDTISNGIYVGGAFTTYNGISANRIIKLTSTGARDTTFYAITGFNDIVRTIAVDLSGRVYVGGDFTTFDYNARNRIVRLLSGGQIDNTFNTVSALTGFDNSVRQITLRNNRVYTAGNFTSYKGETRNRYASLDLTGNTISPFASGTGFNNSVETFAFDNNENIYYAGNFTGYRGFPETRVISLKSNGFSSNSFSENLPPAFQRLTVQGSISSTGSLSATNFSTGSNFNYLAGRVGIGTNTFEGQNLQLAVIGSISGTGGLSATDSSATSVFLGYTNIGPNNTQRYSDRAFFWNPISTVGSSNSLNVLKNGIGSLSSTVVAGMTGSPYFYYSNNNTTWYPGVEPTGVSSIRDIAPGNVFVAIENGPSNKTYISTNGQTWSNGGALPLSIDWGGVGFGNGTYIATGSNASTRTAYSINNGNNWSLGGELPGLGNWSTPAYNPAFNSWVCCRNAFFDGVAYSNNNGITWIQKFVGLALDWSKIIFVPPNIYVMLAASDNKIAYSLDDGDSWTVVNLPVSNNYRNLAFNQIRDFTYVMLTSVNSNKVLVSNTRNLNGWVEVTNLPGIRDWTTITNSASGFLAGASDLTSTYGNFIIDDQRHLNVTGAVSATGALSSSGQGFSFFGGPVGIGVKAIDYNQRLTVVGNVSATGTLSAETTPSIVGIQGGSYLGGSLGLGINNVYGQRLTVIDNISSSGSLSAMRPDGGLNFGMNFFAGGVGVGHNTFEGKDLKLAVMGPISASGSINATDNSGFNYFGGRVMIGGKGPTAALQADRPTYNQRLTVVGSISSTGSLSASDPGGVSVIGNLSLGTNVPYGQRLTIIGNISSTGSLSAIDIGGWNYFGNQVGIGTNIVTDPDIKLTVIGNISSTGGLSATQSTGFNYFAGTMGMGPNFNTAVNSDITRLTVRGNVSATGSLSASDPFGTSFFGRQLIVGVTNFTNNNQSSNLSVSGNISFTGSLTTRPNVEPFPSNIAQFNYFRSPVGIGTNTMEEKNLHLAVIGSVSSDGGLSAADVGSYNYFASRVGIGRMTEQTYTSTGLAVVGSISGTGSITIDTSETSYLSSLVVISPQAAFANVSTPVYNYGIGGITVVGAISSNDALSARTVYVDPLMSSGVPYTYIANSINTSITLPVGYNYIKIMGIGGGGGGGSGRKDSGTSGPKYGGGGGGGGAYAEVIIPLKKLSSHTLWLTSGVGGRGGAAQSTNATNGLNGENGAATVVAVGASQATATVVFIARGGNGGYGGTSLQDTSKGGLAGARSSGGNGADPLLFTLPSGSVADYVAFQYSSESSEYGGSGGGAGGSVNASNNNSFSLFGLSALPGGTGGGNNQITRNGQANIAGANGVMVVAIPGNSENIWGGAGGGGGGATVTTTAAGAGGNGASPGGGGGGGGASGNATGNSGAGGNGGTGYLRIMLF